MEIGEKIRSARIRSGLSQAELGNMLGVQRSAISKWEKGHVVNIKRSTLMKLSKVLNIPLPELVGSDSSDTEITYEQSQETYKVPTPSYRLVSEDELDEIWEKIYEMSAILNMNRKQKLLEYALVLLKEQREEIDQMLELAKGIQK